MKQGFLIRTSESDNGTFGHFFLPGFRARSVELPWRENKVEKSRIRPGTYRCDYWSSDKFDQAYRLHQVPGRTAILIHRGNWAGDKALGKRSDSIGCILLGRDTAVINGQWGVTDSEATINALVDHLGKAPFSLTIIDLDK